MGSWRCSARPWPTRITRCGPATRPFECRRRWRGTRRGPSARTGCRSRSGWGSTRARWWCARSGRICTWITRPWGRRPTWPPGWSRWPRPAPFCSRPPPCNSPRGLCRSPPGGRWRSRGCRIPWRSTRSPARAGCGPDCTRRPRGALDLAQEGHGQLVALVGEPGVGKSRLVYEFTHSHRAQEWLVLEAGSVSYGKATSYLPVIDLLKGYFKIHDRETHREIRERVTGKVLTLDRSLESILPALLALLDVPVDDAHWQALDPPQRRQRTLDAVKHLLLCESQAQPVLVVFEDLHWIDAETQALLDSLVESLPTARLLLLVNYRPEYEHGWVNKMYYNQLRLDALTPESTGELLNTLLGDDPALEPLKRLLVRRGNPFFIEESIRTLVETQMLTREGGAYRLTRPI